MVARPARYHQQSELLARRHDQPWLALDGRNAIGQPVEVRRAQQDEVDQQPQHDLKPKDGD